MIHEKRSTQAPAVSETASSEETAFLHCHEVLVSVRLVVRSNLPAYTREEAEAFAVVLACELNRWAPHAEVIGVDAGPAAPEGHGARRTGGA